MADLTFDPNGHIYKVNGVIVPSVTQVIAAAGLSDFSSVPASVLDAAIQFGNALHKAIELKCKGTLDEESVAEELKPYIAQWDQFCMDFTFFTGQQEYRAYNDAMRVGYCIDHIGHLTDDTALVDVKSGSPKPADVIQMCAYGYLYPAKRILLLYLEKDRYKVIEIKGADRRRGVNIFIAALQLYNFRKECHLL